MTPFSLVEISAIFISLFPAQNGFKIEIFNKIFVPHSDKCKSVVL